jgi:hypothetical protein
VLISTVQDDGSSSLERELRGPRAHCVLHLGIVVGV